MPDFLVPALALPGLGWVALAALCAGLVRGFAGFGTAMIYLPVAAQVMPPVWAIVTLVLVDVVGPVANLPRAWGVAHRPDLMRLVLGAGVTLPFGVMLLAVIPEETYRYGVSVLSLMLLVCLVFGLRWRGELRRGAIYLTGGLSGLSGGIAGLPGPPVILLYMARPLGAAVIRANTMLYLFCFDWLLLGTIAARGGLGWTPVVIGVMMMVPNMVGNVVGGWMFDPRRERIYRWVAYGVIAVSAILGLPVWDGRG